ncbi:MAG: lysophospholipase [Rhodobiaceae bacterium]|nr:MAG: lysophospholipase [Rhodobiaceae bacterium]
MTVHLIKLCVGVEDPETLREYHLMRLAQKKKAKQPQELMHVTRMTPKRTSELLDDGSIYWVMKGVVRCRQAILELRPLVDDEGKSHCGLVLDPEIVLTERLAKRPFQGWRYLERPNAPKDARMVDGEDDMPLEMREELRELGLL